MRVLYFVIMNEFNKLVTQTEENRNLLCLLNNKVDSLLKRFDKLEGKFCTTSGEIFFI